MIGCAANGQRWNSILPGNTTDIAVKHFANVFADHRPAFCGRKDHVNQATCVTVGHGYSREFEFSFECTQDGVLGHFQQSLAGLLLARQIYPGLASRAIKPSLRDWSQSQPAFRPQLYLAACLASGLSFSA